MLFPGECQEKPRKPSVNAPDPLFADLRLDRHASLFPRMPSADERTRLRPACLSQEERRTGARGFVNSSTVHHKSRSLIQPQGFRIFHWLVWVNANRPRCLRLRIPSIPLSSRIDENDFLTCRLKRAHFVDRDLVLNLPGRFGWLHDGKRSTRLRGHRVGWCRDRLRFRISPEENGDTGAMQ
jgi:hypothetical protein